jgi:hypothetical protein
MARLIVVAPGDCAPIGQAMERTLDDGPRFAGDGIEGGGSRRCRVDGMTPLIAIKSRTLALPPPGHRACEREHDYGA